jgi:hypothetical protein
MEVSGQLNARGNSLSLSAGQEAGWVTYAVAYRLRHYATNRKVAASIPDEVIFFSIYLILPAELDPGVHSPSNRNEY